MKRLLPVMLAGALALSFSPIALSQSVGVQGSAKAGATADLENPKLPDAKRQESEPRAEDKNPDSPGKGWAKGRERGKGHGANDERHGGRHSDRGSTSRDEDRGKY